MTLKGGVGPSDVIMTLILKNCLEAPPTLQYGVNKMRKKFFSRKFPSLQTGKFSNLKFLLVLFFSCGKVLRLFMVYIYM